MEFKIKFPIMERMGCGNWLLNMSKSQIRSKTELVKPMKGLQLSVTAQGWTLEEVSLPSKPVFPCPTGKNSFIALFIPCY